ncbi:beta-galactosidase [Streptomyces sp. NPDC006654]|uniref:beta-galactosidase n=1 Tax=Streptomyces sp. NPDC006654 TaxID=3156897 RepID=UPI0034096461
MPYPSLPNAHARSGLSALRRRLPWPRRLQRRAVTFLVGLLTAALAGGLLYALPGLLSALGIGAVTRMTQTASGTSVTCSSAGTGTPSGAGSAFPLTSGSGSGSGSSLSSGSPSVSDSASGSASGAGSDANAPSPASDDSPSTGTGTGACQGASAAGRTFQGIYAFSGGNASDLAADPDVAGRSLVYYWAQLEPQQGQYRWDLIDKDMQPWITAGKKVILRVSAAGWAKWDQTADSAHGTPAWVYAQGVKSVTEQDGAVLPQYWNPAFQTDLAAFLKAFATRYDGNAHVAAVDISIGVGGESKADSEKSPGLLSLWQAIGYTDELWWQYAQATITAYTSVFRATPLALMPDKTFIGGTDGYNEQKIVDYAVAKNIWLQDNGVVPGRTLSAPWGRTPVIAEMRGATNETGDNLKDDLDAALAEHPTIILVFTSDITDANRAVLHQAAGPVSSAGSGTADSPGSAGTPSSADSPSSGGSPVSDSS